MPQATHRALVELLNALGKTPPTARFDLPKDESTGGALIACGGSLVLASGPNDFHVFSPDEESLGEPDTVRLEGIELTDPRGQIVCAGGVVVVLARDASGKPVFALLDPRKRRFTTQPAEDAGDWPTLKASGDRLYLAPQAGKELGVWSVAPGRLTRESRLSVPVDDWRDFAVCGDQLAFLARKNNAPTTFFALEGGVLVPRGETKGKFNAQSKIALYEDGIAVLFGAHKKAHVLRRGAGGGIESLGAVGVSNEYQGAVRFDDAILLCDASPLMGPARSVQGKFDAIRLLSGGIEKMTVSTTARLLGAARLGDWVCFLHASGRLGGELSKDSREEGGLVAFAV